ncbi:hypothetical protein [Kocuria sp.]|uniref:hypothetical protein n=1 Tax=Kocuria TaxID=57493 RepID=UPI0025C64BA9|nr:hypothetical protein [Kocuria sp.]
MAPHSQSFTMPTHLSQARFNTYRRCAAGDAEAFELYRWNLHLTGAVFEMLGVVEVALRNAIDRQLRQWNAAQSARPGDRPYSNKWLEHPAHPLYGLLNTKARGGYMRSTFDEARKLALKDGDLRRPGHPRHGHAVTHDDVLAHVTFGTWPHLFPDPRFEHIDLGTLSNNQRRKERFRRTMWEQALNPAFPGQGRSYTVGHWVGRMHELRNRVAHHEPLILANVRSYHLTAARLLMSIDPHIGNWYAGTSRVPEVLKRCPIDLTPHQLH